MVLTKEQIQTLTELYYDPREGLTHAAKLKLKTVGIPLADIKAFIKKQNVGQLYYQSNKKEFYPITAPPNSYQADLIFMKHRKINNGYDVALTVIEITSRRGYCYPMKNKQTHAVMAAFTQFMKDIDNMLDNLTTDKGSEFRSFQFKALMRTHNVSHYLADEGDHSKMGMIERFNRTIKALISKYLTAYNTKKYIDALPDLLYNYNHTVHSGIGYAPVDVGDREGADIRIDARAKTRALDAKKNLHVGDKVRIRKKRGLFQKEGRRWSDKVYTITKDHVKTFEINDDSDRRYKHYDLVKVGVPATENPYERTSTSFDVEEHLKAARAKRKKGPREKKEPVKVNVTGRPIRQPAKPGEDIYAYY